MYFQVLLPNKCKLFCFIVLSWTCTQSLECISVNKSDVASRVMLFSFATDVVKIRLTLEVLIAGVKYS